MKMDGDMWIAVGCFIYIIVAYGLARWKGIGVYHRGNK